MSASDMISGSDVVSGEWHLEIADGPNAGACLTLAPGRYRIGRDPANDIVLCDPAIAEEHALVEINASGARLTSLELGHTSINGRDISPGPAHNLRVSSQFRLGNTVLHLRARQAPRGSTHMFGRLGACVLVGAAVAAATFVALSSHALPQPRQTDLAVVAAPTLERARAELAARIAGAGLEPELRVTAADGALLVAGSLAPGGQAAWRAQEAWYDQHYARHFGLMTNITPQRPDDTPALDIAAVSLAPVANIVTRSGEHYTEGAITPDGWSIVSITTRVIVVRRGTREMRITL